MRSLPIQENVHENTSQRVKQPTFCKEMIDFARRRLKDYYLAQSIKESINFYRARGCTVDEENVILQNLGSMFLNRGNRCRLIRRQPFPTEGARKRE